MITTLIAVTGMPVANATPAVYPPYYVGGMLLGLLCFLIYLAYMLFIQKEG